MTLFYVLFAIIATLAGILPAWNASAARIRARDARQPFGGRTRRALAALGLLVLGPLAGCNGGGLLVVEDAGTGGGPTTSTSSTSTTTETDAGECATKADGLICTLPDGTAGECVAGGCVANPSACHLTPCPVGSSHACSFGQGFTACCNGVLPSTACSEPAGIVTDVCPVACTSNACAISPMGTTTCCNPALGTKDPCQQPVP